MRAAIKKEVSGKGLQERFQQLYSNWQKCVTTEGTTAKALCSNIHNDEKLSSHCSHMCKITLQGYLIWV